jgi:hypothetical protein
VVLVNSGPGPKGLTKPTVAPPAPSEVDVPELAKSAL